MVEPWRFGLANAQKAATWGLTSFDPSHPTPDSELLTWAAAGCLARSVFVGVTQRVAQLVGGSRVNLMSGK